MAKDKRRAVALRGNREPRAVAPKAARLTNEASAISSFFDCFFYLWLFKLLADCDTETSPHQLGEIIVEGVMWEAMRLRLRDC